ncbi:MAG: hypothetical protein SNJ63_08785 [Sphingomonadaceae bacterium]
MLGRRGFLGGALTVAAWPALADTRGLLASGGFDRPAFDAWVKVRVGTGDPVFWYSEGTVRRFPTGELLAFLEGFDTARSHWPEPGQPVAHQYNRKIYVWRDRETGEPLRGADGAPAPDIAYPYQFITYRLSGDRVETMVEQGSGNRLARIGPEAMMAVRRQGRTLIFTAPVYLDLAIGPSARMQAFENYDFVADPEAPPETWVLSWMRTGEAPPALGGGPAVLHLVTRRFERFADLPERMRRHVETSAPLWRQPPADLAEIRRLQAG